MGRIGTSELILIFAIALIFFGPSKLPELGKMIGRSIGTAKRYMNEVEEELNIEGKTKKDDKDVKEEKEKEELVVDARTASEKNN